MASCPTTTRRNSIAAQQNKPCSSISVPERSLLIFSCCSLILFPESGRNVSEAGPDPSEFGRVRWNSVAELPRSGSMQPAPTSADTTSPHSAHPASACFTPHHLALQRSRTAPEREPTLGMQVDLCPSRARSKPPKFGRARPDVGLISADCGPVRIWPKLGQFRPTSANFDPVSTKIHQLWAEFDRC